MEGSRAIDLADSAVLVAPSREVTMVFCDIAEFTRFTVRLGDVASYRLVRRCEQLVVALVRERGGDLLETRGDGFLLAFDSPPAAADCSAAIQQEIERADQLPVQVRVGMHTGFAIHDGGRYFGRTVIEAFRVSSLARAEEVLVSDETRRRLSDTELRFEPAHRVRLKGLAGQHRVWRMNWRAARKVQRSYLGTSVALRASLADARASAAGL